MTQRKPTTTGPLELRQDGDNLYGRRTVHGVSSIVGERRMRRAIHFDAAMYHKPKNGVYDAVTHYHVLDLLARLSPGQEFRTSDIVAMLRERKEKMVWDATTVGRVITDLAESLNEANGTEIITSIRRYDGMIFAVNVDGESMRAIVNLLDDLARLSQTMLDEITRGNTVKRYDSPLRECPSVAMIR